PAWPPPPGGAWQPPPPAPPAGAGWTPPGSYGYQPPATKKTEPLSIVALVFGVISFIFCPFVGAIAAIIFAWRAKVAIKASNNEKTGRGMAIAGQILGIVNIVFSIGLAALIVAGGVFASHHTSYTRLQAGDCFNRDKSGLFGQGGPLSSLVTVVDCNKAHDAEVVGTFIAPDSSYPGLRGFQIQAGPRCSALEEQYVTTPHPGLVNRFLYPSKSLWDSGTRVVVCEVRNADGSKLTGSVGGAGGVTRPA
ncbi:MAG: DUF4190 domain-containing protein, partial [Actinomycetota bacterium]|nr:DUF4190 domain-containing protein [Actinomycetota bacterium]